MFSDVLILAGNVGEKLRPLTCSRPKVMLPIANKQLIEWMLERLADYGLKRAIISSSQTSEIKPNIGSQLFGIEILYQQEKKPLGTGGSVKQAEKIIGHKDPFLVIKGDSFSDIDYNKLETIHKENKRIATLTLHVVSNQSRYRSVKISDRSEIIRFIENPYTEESFLKFDMMNTGAYVFEPRIFEAIPINTEVSLERDLFPMFAKQRTLQAYIHPGYSIDVSTPQDYFLATRIILDRMTKEKTFLENLAEIDPSAKFIPPVLIGKNVKIEKNVILGPYSTIGDGTAIQSGSRVEGSIVFPNVTIRTNSSIKGAILGESASIGERVTIKSQVIVGGYTLITDNSTLRKNMKICSSQHRWCNIHDQYLKTGWNYKGSIEMVTSSIMSARAPRILT